MKNLQWKLTFGKHKGETLQWVLKENPLYILWASENIDWFNQMLKDNLSAQDRGYVYKIVQQASKDKDNKRIFDNWFGLGFSEFNDNRR